MKVAMGVRRIFSRGGATSPFCLSFSTLKRLRNISLGGRTLGKSKVIITVGWVWWRHQMAPYLVFPRAPQP